MTPSQFVAKWKDATLKERSASQSHFNDLCSVLGVENPTDADKHGKWYCFERGATKSTGGEGWADVWKKGHFGWEYKGKRKDLNEAFLQLQRYAVALENPPLLIVSDMDTIIIHTNFTNTVGEKHVIPIEDLGKPEVLQTLKWAFTDPEKLRPGLTTEKITAAAAGDFAELAQTLHKRGNEPQAVAHFLNKVLFCLFAEDAELLPPKLFARMIDAGVKHPAQFSEGLKELFAKMTKGGWFGPELIKWFNGGLFDGDDVLPLDAADLKLLQKTAQLDWSAIQPSIFGTLFERGLDPAKRSQLGANYTDPQTIMRIVNPVVVEPLLAEWEQVKAGMLDDLEKEKKAKSPAAKTKAHKSAQARYQKFLQRLADYRVLDPACGSGNFLYLALHSLKDLELRVMLEAQQIGFEMGFPGVNVKNVMGIELNPYAAELARVTIWIGEIQWLLAHGFNPSDDPVLKKLDRIENRDAIMNEDGTEAEWPACDAIIGNPPFLGDKKMVGGLGEDYAARLRRLYAGRVPGMADLVLYWFEKARGSLLAGRVESVGLVSTNSIRGGKNRSVIDRILDDGFIIFEAWGDEPWVNEGADVRVSILCFGRQRSESRLNGEVVTHINPDLTAGKSGEADITKAMALKENELIAFIGTSKKGKFEIPGNIARQWLAQPNPHGRTNAEVLRPWVNGMDITRRPEGYWIVDFGAERSMEDAALYEAPFAHVVVSVKPAREQVRNPQEKKNWWLHARSLSAMRGALAQLPRYLISPRVSKHRVFVWMHPSVLPDSATVAFARSDDTFFGVMQSRMHTLWTLARCTWLGVGNDPRYSPSLVFDPFPFPEGLTPARAASSYASDPRAQRIADAAKELNELRERWLNPPEWTDRMPEVVPGYPDRVVPKPGYESELKKRTLTNLYNERPAWLANAHKKLDEAVAAAYGWPTDLSDDEILRRLLELNLQRAGKAEMA